MIAEKEVSEILSEELPELKTELDLFSKDNNLYKVLQCFVDFTRKLIYEGKLNEVKHCFIIAERMLEEGNKKVKNAIENVYVYSLGTVVELSAMTANQLKEIFNGSLRKEYHRQITASSI